MSVVMPPAYQPRQSSRRTTRRARQAVKGVAGSPVIDRCRLVMVAPITVIAGKIRRDTCVGGRQEYVVLRMFWPPVAPTMVVSLDQGEGMPLRHRIAITLATAVMVLGCGAAASAASAKKPEPPPPTTTQAPKVFTSMYASHHLVSTAVPQVCEPVGSPCPPLSVVTSPGPWVGGRVTTCCPPQTWPSPPPPHPSLPIYDFWPPAGGPPLAGALVTFTVKGTSTVIGTAVTDSNGLARCSVDPVLEPAVLQLGVTATYAGDATYVDSSNSNTRLTLT
jgi:hypothetical protein